MTWIPPRTPREAFVEETLVVGYDAIKTGYRYRSSAASDPPRTVRSPFR